MNLQHGTAVAIGGLVAIGIIAAFGSYGWVALGSFTLGYFVSELSAYWAYGRWRD